MAIGTGALYGWFLLWLLSALLLLVPLSFSIGLAFWFAWPAARPWIDEQLVAAITASLAAVGLSIMMRTFVVIFGAGTFVGPANHLRDIAAAAAQSRTLRRSVLSAGLMFTLGWVLQTDVGGPVRPFLILGTSTALIVLDVLILRGVAHIFITNRRSPYFDGMSEPQKQIADRPWPALLGSSFPDSRARISALDAARYRRRALAIARAHEWTGAGLILIFSAFVGTAATASWESREPYSIAPMFVVLGLVAVGFFIQRRARSYRTLAASFEDAKRWRPPQSLNARARQIRRRHIT